MSSRRWLSGPLLAGLFVAGLFSASAIADGNPSASNAHPDDDWVVIAKARKPNDISLWTRTIDGAELKAFRGATELEIPLDSLIAFLDDTPRMSTWLFRCQHAKVLTRAENGIVYVYIQISGIWPLGDRDVVMKIIPDYDPATGVVRMTGQAVPTYLPPVKGFVRIPSLESIWLIRPTEQGRLHVEWSGHVEPGGKVPHWLANVLAPLVPRYTLSQLREEISQPLWMQPAQRELGAELLANFKKPQN